MCVYEIDDGAGKGDAVQAKKDYLAADGATFPMGELFTTPDVVVDAMFGTGLRHSLDNQAQRWINMINAIVAPILAIDIPSGLDADTGAMRPCAVRAEATVTFIVHKRGMYTAWGPDCCGEILFDSLGTPDRFIAQVESATQLIGFHDASDQLGSCLPHRYKNTHKGDFGHVLVIGGTTGMAGAVRLAGEAALRAGAGLVSVATSSENVVAIVAGCPALMVQGVKTGKELNPLLERASVIVIGPGLGRESWGCSLLEKVLESKQPKVIDADALHLLAKDPVYSDRWVLTPHPGEAASLLGISTAEVSDDRFDASEKIVSSFGGVCVLKGNGTLIHSNKRTLICAGGNPSMATAGMGDVLSGIVAALIAQGVSLSKAAEIGTCVHAEAGDRVAKNSSRGLIATDLMPHIRDCLN